jgi:hypothetical protein
MSNFKEYAISETATGTIDKDTLIKEINDSMTCSIENVLIAGDNIVCVFTEDLNQTDIEILDGIIAYHMGNSLLFYENIVSKSVEFFNNMMINCAAKNVLEGITQAGKTRDVADYLKDAMRYGQSGSLYEVVNEIDRKISEGIPTELSPFITDEKLLDMKNKALTFLNNQ